LNTLATAREDNTGDALLEIDQDLQARITRSDNTETSDETGGPITMKVSLASNSDTNIRKGGEK
jgi:hypothetical protein